MPGETIAKLGKLIKARGGELAAGFELNMGSTDMPKKNNKNFWSTRKRRVKSSVNMLLLKNGENMKHVAYYAR